MRTARGRGRDAAAVLRVSCSTSRAISWIPAAASRCGARQSQPPTASLSSAAGPNCSDAQAQSEARRADAVDGERAPETNRRAGAPLVEMGRLDQRAGWGPATRSCRPGVCWRWCWRARTSPTCRWRAASRRYRELGRPRRASAPAACASAPAAAADRRRPAGAAAAAWACSCARRAAGAAGRCSPEMLLATQPNVDEIGIDATTLARYARESTRRRARCSASSGLASVARAVEDAPRSRRRGRQPKHTTVGAPGGGVRGRLATVPLIGAAAGAERTVAAAGEAASTRPARRRWR